MVPGKKFLKGVLSWQAKSKHKKVYISKCGTVNTTRLHSISHMYCYCNSGPILQYVFYYSGDAERHLRLKSCILLVKYIKKIKMIPNQCGIC